MQKKYNHLRIQLFFVFLLFIINIGTLVYVTPLQQNLSDLGNALGHRAYLILWACTASLYFYVYSKQLYHEHHYVHPLGTFVLKLSCVGMVVSILFPYDPISAPTLAKWHTRLAMLSTVAYALSFYHFLFETMKKDYAFFEKGFIPYTFIIMFCALLYLLNGGVSTLLEISFVIAMSTYLLYMQKRD